ncbi:MAG: flippase [Clostridia bacterium]|nr:flippase [Clostridia bacterium]
MKDYRVVKNASWIIVCKVIEAVFHLSITMLTTRYLGPSNYGIINYAVSLVAFALPIMQLGLRNILINEFVNAPEQKGRTLGTALCMNFLSSLLCVVGVTAFSAIANPGDTETVLVCLLYSFCLVFQAVEVMQYWFQELLLSKYVSLSMLAAYVLMSVYQVIILLLHKNIYWFAVSEAIRHMIVAALLLILYRKKGGEKLSVSLAACRRMLSRSKHYILSNLMITIYAQVDKIMLMEMAGETVTGYYSAAYNCTYMTNFVFLAIVDSMRPGIFRSKLTSEETFEKKLTQLYAIVIWLSVAQSLVFTVFAPLIIRILNGVAYLPAVGMLQIVVWFTVFTHVGLVRDMWILTEEKQKYLWRINIFGAVFNVALNYFLIPALGGEGAAIASLLSQFITNVAMCFVFKELRRAGILMARGADPRVLIGFLAGLRK